MKISMFCLIVCLSLVSIYGQKTKVRVEKLSLEEGISHNMVYSITQDSEKFLWFGTMFGLVRYDGLEYLKYRGDINDTNTLSDDDIVTITEGNEGKLWIGTFGGGVNAFDPLSETFSRFTPKNMNLEEWDGIVWKLAQDAGGNIWIATNNSGLLRLNPSTKNVSIYKNSDSNTILPSNTIREIKWDLDHLWIGGYGGIAKYDPKKAVFEIFSDPEIENSIIMDFAFYGRDTILCGTNNGLFIFSRTLEKFSKVITKNKNRDEVKNINTLLVSDDGKIWVGSNSGVFILKDFKLVNQIDQSDGLYSNNIVSMHQDHSGNIWVGSYLGGISKIIRKPGRFEFIDFNTIEPTVNKVVVKDIIRDSNNQIFITTSNHLFKLDENYVPVKLSTDLKLKLNENSAVRINSVKVDKVNNFFIGSNKGVLKFDTDLNFIRKYTVENHNISSNFITKLLFDSKDNLWIGTINGISKLNVNDESVTNWNPNSDKNNITGQHILSIYEDYSGFIWVGTYRGLNIINPITEEVKFIGISNSNNNTISNKYIFDFYEPDSNNIWIATGNGINVYNRINKQFNFFNEKDGLPNGVIQSIIGHKNNIYIATNKGISVYDKLKNEFRNFSIADGLGNNIFTADASIIASEGDILFGGLNGISILKTKGNYDNRVLPENKITSVKVFGKELENINSDHLVLGHDQNTISFRFASLEFTNPENNRFAYKLKGLDSNWIVTNKNYVDYHLLPNNKYTFQLKSSNPDGYWNNNFAQFSFEILPPFWKTSWFYILLGSFIAAILVLIHKSRVKRKLQVFLEIEEAKKEENEIVRKRAAEDFHDELGHLIARISLLVEVLKRKYTSSKNEDYDKLSRLSNLSHELSNKMRDFIWSLDSRNDSLYDVIVRLKDFGDDIFYDTAVSFSIIGINNALKDIKLSLDWRRHLTLIFKEGMNNILKYSNCENAELVIKRNNNILMIELKDDGKGFDLTKIKRGNGLRNMRSRAEYIKAKLAIISNINRGTEIKFEGMVS